MSQAPRPNRTLAQAVADADAHITVLDDRIDVDDAAVFRWLRGHQVHAGRLHHLVIGSQPLPPAWRAVAIKIASPMQAQNLVRSAEHDSTALRALEAAWREVEAFAKPAAPADVIAKVVAALDTGRMWAIETRHAPHSRFSTRTSPTAFAPINARFGTRINFTFIAKLEGDQWLRGYIPIKRSGVVMGRSGMTVASGFDVGQRSAAEMSSFGFPPALASKLKPFADQPFKGRTKDQVAATVAKLGPVPILTKQEADLCDGAVFAAISGGALANWNANALPGVPAFTDLPSGWQTVWLSRFYQEGPATHVALGRKFRGEALAGKWKEAISTLKSYSEYTARAKAEAALLEAEMPATPSGPKGHG